MTTPRKCQAKDPRTCPYHGAEITMNETLAAGDGDGYFQARLKFEAIKKAGFKEGQPIEQASPSELPLPFHIIKNRKNEKLEATKISANLLPQSILAPYGLKPNDEISVGKRADYRYFSYLQKFYIKREKGWEKLGEEDYTEVDIKKIMAKYNLKINEAVVACLLEKASKRKTNKF